MEEKTQKYIKGRFSDYYRSVDLGNNIPTDIDDRELGRITWNGPMIRHDSLFQSQELSGYLNSTTPRHSYFSCGKYENPSETNMNNKKWIGSDLIFDLDADPSHMPMIDSDTPYTKALEICKEELNILLDSLQRILSPSDIHVFFSGSRGYHVHVRDESVQNLSRGARTELINLLSGNNITYDSITTNSKIFTENGLYFNSGYWGDMMYKTLEDKIQEINSISSKDEKIDKLQEISGIETKADNILSEIEDIGTFFVSMDISRFPKPFIEWIITETIQERTVHIDTPVSSDVNRLIRIPDSLHGGSGLTVDAIPVESIDEYNPLKEAIPNRFMESSLQVKVKFTEDSVCFLEDTKKVFNEGETYVLDEHIAIHECCKEKANVIEVGV